MIILNIPVPTYLYKYLTVLYGTPYKPTMYDELGVMILSSLERKVTCPDILELKTWKGKEIDKFFVVQISLSQFERKGFYLFNEKIHQIQTFIDNQFRLNMYRNAAINFHQLKIPYKDSILSFLSSYGITEEDFSYESIRKDFNRKKDFYEKRLSIKSEAL